MISAQGAVVARYSNRRAVGLHYGSREHDLRAVAEWLDRWPNYVVDTAARLGEMIRNAARDREAVRRFFKQHIERIIWGVDVVQTAPLSLLSAERQAGLLSYIQKRYQLECQFYATDNWVEWGPNRTRGLALDNHEIELLMRGNARRIYGLPK